MNTRPSSSGGFTRLELVAVTSVTLVLVSLSPSLWSDFQTQSKMAVCLSNQQQLTAGWLMYADANNGRLVANFSLDLTGQLKSWVTGLLDWNVRSDNTNTLYLVHSRHAAMSVFVGRNPRLFKCPDDAYLSPSQEIRRWKERVRTYSMNAFMGDGTGKTGFGGSEHTVYLTLDQIVHPSPAQAFVFTEEHPDSMNDPILLFNPTLAEWVDGPAALHNGAAVFSFADGHIEAHRWENQSGWIRPVSFNNFNRVFLPAQDPDWLWVQQRATARRLTNP